MGSIVVPYASVQQAFMENPTAVHDTISQAANTVAAGDPEQRAQLIAQWHDALAALQAADNGPAVLSTPRNDLASRVQTLIASRAFAEGKTQTTIPAAPVVTEMGSTMARETVQVKFDNNDLIDWLAGNGSVKHL